jgi:Ca2+-binding RTX toxin-like protein
MSATETLPSGFTTGGTSEIISDIPAIVTTARAVALAGGGFVMEWISGGVFHFQLIDENGAKVGAEIVFDDVPVGGNQYDSPPSLAALAGGGFVLGYEGSGGSSYIQVFASDGSTVGDLIVIPDARFIPSVAATPDGGFVVAYHHADGHVAAQTFNANGQSTHVVDLGTPSSMAIPITVQLSDGTVLVSTFGISSVIDSSGQITRTFPLPSMNFSNCSFAALPDGGIAVAWEENWQLHFQLFDAAGNARSDLVTFEEPGAFSSIAVLPDGSFFLVWISPSADETQYLPYGHLVDADGTPQGDTILMPHSTNVDFPVALLLSADGDLLFLSGAYPSLEDQSAFDVGATILHFSPGAEPTGITLTGGVVTEGATAGFVVGTLIASDPDEGDTFTFEIIDDDSDFFVIVGDQVRVAPGAIFDYEEEDAYYITVEVRDSQDNTFSTRLRITVQESNAPPTGIHLDNTLILEDADAGTPVGRLWAWDPNSRDSHSFSLLDDAGGLFEIVDGYVVIAEGASLSLGGATQHQITVRVTDSGGLTHNETITIGLLPNVNPIIEPRGPESQVNTTVDSSQYSPTIATLSDGSFVVSWMSWDQDGSGWGIYAQRYDSSGVKSGGEFPVTTHTAGAQSAPKVTALSNGGFVVTWMSEQDGSGFGIYAQCFDSSGAKTGAEFLVNSTTLNDQFNPSITALSDGGFAVTWMSRNAAGDQWHVYAKIYDPSGAVAVDEFRVNDTTAGGMYPAIASLKDGGFVITWDAPGSDGNDIRAQRYDDSGNKVGSEFVANSTTANNQYSSSVTGLSDGGYVITWQSQEQDGSDLGIYAQRYGADGVAIGDEFLVNTVTQGSQENPSITALSDGGFVISWNAIGNSGIYNSGSDIYARVYDAAGTPQGLPFRLNDNSDGNQYAPAITSSAGGGFIATWMSNEQGEFDIYARVFGPEIVIIEGVVADGLIAGATVFRDANGNRTLDAGEANTITGPDGSFTLTGGSGPLVAAGGINTDTGLANTLTMSAPAGSTVINPLTTLVQAVLLSAPAGTTAQQAAAMVAQALGISSSIDLLNIDVFSAAATNPAALEAQKAAATIVTMIGAAVDASGSAGAAATMMDSLAGVVLSTGVGEQVDLTDRATIEMVLAGTVDPSEIATVSSSLAQAAENIASATNLGELSDAQGSAMTSGNDLDNLLTGGTMNDHLFGFGGNDRLFGNGGDDRLDGGAGDDLLDGGAGNDTLFGGAGNDTLEGGAGDDTATYDGAAAGVTVSLSVTAAQNTVGAGTDTLLGAENLVGSSFDDRLTGDSGDNRLEGSGGNDVLNGAAGNDLLIGGVGADRLDGGIGNDTADYSASAAAVSINLVASKQAGGDATGDTLVSIENVTGSAFDDKLVGDQNGNVLIGGAGNDTINGGGGVDVLWGGAGSDLFVFKTPGEATGDKIMDFEAGGVGLSLATDRIDLSGIDAIAGSKKDDSFTFIGDRGFTGKAGELQVLTQNGVATVSGDVNGDGKADFSFTVQYTGSLDTSDFLF